MKNNIVKKGLTFGIIVLFIGIAIAPSVTSIGFSKTTTSNNNDLVEITLELYKPNGIEDHKMFITQEQDEQLDLLIESFKANLDNAETKEETIEIYNDMVVSLDELGILPDSTSYKEVQELVIGENSISNPEKLMVSKYFNIDYEKLKNKNLGLDENENIFCLIAGRTTRTDSFGLGTFLLATIVLSLWIRVYIFLELIEQFFGCENNLEDLYRNYGMLRTIFWISLIIPTLINPLRIGGFMTFGKRTYDPSPYDEEHYYPAEGWLYTFGLNGKKTWADTFYGQIFGVPTGPFTTQYLGANGFTGVKIIGMNFYLGSAFWVKIGPSHP